MTESENLIVAKDLALSTGKGPLFEELNCSFSDDSRIGLVGPNGAGKSTLLRILAKLSPADEGDIIYRRNTKTEYVPQFAPPEIMELTVFEGVMKKLEQAAPPREEWEAYMLLDQFGFTDQLYNSKFKNLSGGEANRALLVCAVASNPDFIFLDEPTNHMDSEAIDWFEQLIKTELKIPFCVVSHDRDLLDGCTNTTLFLRDKRIYQFRAPYSKAVEELDAYDESLRKQRNDQQKELDRLEESANKLKVWAKLSDKMSPRLRAMRTRAERLQDNLIEIPKQKKREITVSTAEVQVKRMLSMRNFDVYAGDRKLFHVDNFEIAPGERVAILGRNGTGKTSLLRTIVRNFPEPTEGGIKFNPQVSIGYYDQDLGSLKPSDTLFDHIHRNANVSNDKARSELIKAGFDYDRHNQRIQTLSGGEKARLQFLTIKLQQPSVLLLDEPTNHIDVGGIENLEYHLLDSPTACIFVSHDRRFLNTVATRFYLISKGSLTEIGDLDIYYESLLNPTSGL